jgi:flagellar assembly factor FliW
MKFEVKKDILGFENIREVELVEIDDLFARLKSLNSDINFSLVNPYLLREYSFNIPLNVQVLLDIKEDSKILVYNMVVINEPLKESVVNFKAPVIFNKDNGTCAQFILNGYEGTAKLGDFIKGEE